MKKTVYNIGNFKYRYDGERKGAKYSWYDPIKGSYTWGNVGDLFEVADKFAKGLPPHKDGKGKYNESSDIEETHTSCKSWYFTLATIKAESFEKVLDIYWKDVASTNFDFGWIEGDDLVVYNMNADEFNQFLYRFATYKKSDKVIRGPRLSNARRIEVETWLEMRI